METSKTVSLVSLNCYLIPIFFTYRQPWSAPSRLNQAARAKRIGEYIKNHDVVVLQEVWGSQVGVLENEIQKTHIIPPGYRSTNIFGYFGNMFDAAKFWWQQNGGLWFSYKKQIRELYRAKRTFATSETSSRKGVQAMLLDMDSYWPNRYLLIFNTHLDPMNDNNKWLQSQEIFEFMGETIQDLQHISHGNQQAIVSSASSFNSSTTKNDFNWKQFNFNHCGVLVIGDFNASSNSSLSKRIREHFGARDLYKEYITQHNMREEPTFDYSKNSLAEIIQGLSARIDYIYAIDQYKWPSSRNPEENTLKFMRLEVDEFKIQNNQPRGEELSDHWPLEVKLRCQ